MADSNAKTFSNSIDASKVRKEADNKVIQLDQKTLTLLPVNECDQSCNGADKKDAKKETSEYDDEVSNEIIEKNETINIDFINNLNDDCLTSILNYLPIVDYLNVERVCKRWKDITSRRWKVAKHLHLPIHLKNYNVYNVQPSICRVVYKKIFTFCGNSLRFLKFTNHKNHIDIDASLLAMVSKLCPNIEKFVLAQRYYRNDYYLSRWFGRSHRQFTRQTLEKMRSLHSLWLCFVNLEPNVFSAISKMRHLRSLKLCYCILNGQIEQIYELRNLRHLDLRGVHEITDEFLWNLTKNCICLEYLNISMTCQMHISYYGVEAVTQFSKLKILHVSGLRTVEDGHLRHLTTIEELYCDNCVCVQDFGVIKLIENSPNLRLLSLFATGVTPELIIKVNLCLKKRSNNIPLRIIIEESKIIMYESIKEDKPSSLLIVEEWNDQDNEDKHPQTLLDDSDDDIIVYESDENDLDN